MKIEMTTTIIQIKLKTNKIIEINNQIAINHKTNHKKIGINKMMITSIKEMAETNTTQMMMISMFQNRPKIRIEIMVITKIKMINRIKERI